MLASMHRPRFAQTAFLLPQARSIGPLAGMQENEQGGWATMCLEASDEVARQS